MSDDKRGLWQALLAWLTAGKNQQDTERQNVVEQTAAGLPDEVMPYEAVLRKRQQLAELDRILEE